MITTEKKIYYRESFLEKLAEVKKYYANGEVTRSIGTLNQMNNKDLLPAEIAKKRNLLGVIYFGQKDNDRAVSYFHSALVTSNIDVVLTTQIYLNLSSAYYVMGMYDQAYSQLILGVPSKLKIEEQRKYYNLMYETSKMRGIDKDIIYSLANFLGTFKTISEFKGAPEYEVLKAYFGKFNLRQKLHFFDEFSEKKYLVVGYLAFLEAEKLYYEGEKDDANDITSWIEGEYEGNDELMTLVTTLKGKSTNTSKFNKKRIAVVLPFTDSGKKKVYANRVLRGIDLFLKQQKLDYELVIKDSKGSPSVGAQVMEDAIVKDQAGVVIGGLFSNEAKEEYLVAKKEGALFISLSQIYLPSIQKDHSLIEIPGSIESQLDLLFSPEFLDTFGKRAILLYSKSEKGTLYADRFWELAAKHGVTVSSIQNYEKGTMDFREPVKRMLGLGYPRQRREELDLLKDIYSLEKNTPIYRLQYLKPQIDFDWVFLPVSPKDAVQVIPAFRYYDAFRLRKIGTPDWRSRTVINQSRNFGTLYFLGSDLNSSAEALHDQFAKLYGSRRLGLIEINSLMAVKVADKLLSDENIGEMRMNLDLYLKNKLSFNIGEESWKNSGGIWIKQMNLMRLRHKQTTKVDFSLLPKINDDAEKNSEREDKEVSPEENGQKEASLENSKQAS